MGRKGDDVDDAIGRLVSGEDTDDLLDADEQPFPDSDKLIEKEP